MVIQFLTGIGILLFGVNVLSSSFEKLCGVKIKNAINKYSSNRYNGSFFGGVLTFFLQSSTASGALIAGLANVGVLSLFQAVCLIFGSNIGGAISHILVAFQSINLVGYFGLLTLIGVFMRILFKNKSVRNWGMCLCGFGLLFTGLSLISSATEVLKTSEAFLNLISSIDSPVLLILIGIAGTAILQSSLGMMAIVASIMGTTGLISVYSAAFIVYGMNVGTCLILVIIGATTGRQALRVALSRLGFNVVGCILFSLVSIWDWVTPCTSFISNTSIQIVVVDILFNIVTCIILLPFAKQISKLFEKIVPDKVDKKEETQVISQDFPALALVQLSKNASTLFSDTAHTLETAMDYVCIEGKVDSTQIRSQIDDTLSQSDEMIAGLFGTVNSLSDKDKPEAEKLNSIYTGIKKTNVNIQKLLNSCEEGENKIDFTQKQEKTITDIKNLMTENLADMNLLMNEEFIGDDESLDPHDVVQNIINRLETMVNKKVQAKRSVVQNSISESYVTKYTAFLNVINYFEQINTNLTDIILELIASKNFHEEEKRIDKIQNHDRIILIGDGNENK